MLDYIDAGQLPPLIVDLLDKLQVSDSCQSIHMLKLIMNLFSSPVLFSLSAQSRLFNWILHLDNI